jgi:hypothetical protein
MHRLQHGGILPANSRAAMFLSAPDFHLQNRIGERGKIVFNVRALTETRK